MLNTNLWRIVYEFFNSLVESSTAGFVDFGNLIRLPFSSMIPNLNASVSSKGVVNNLRNLYVTNKSIALPIRVPSITLELPHLFRYDRSSSSVIVFRKIRNDFSAGQYSCCILNNSNVVDAVVPKTLFNTII